MKQEKVPCLVDNDAHLATKDDDKYVLQTKPHGHGDVHALIAPIGFVEAMEEYGREMGDIFPGHKLVGF